MSSDKANRWSMESAPQAYGTGLSFLSRALPLCTHFFNHARTLVSILECSLISGELVLWTMLLSRVFLPMSSLIP